jgi:hypothetical protein
MLYPGKGSHLVLNEEYLGWMRSALDEVTEAYSDDLHDSAPDEVIKVLNRDYEWESVNDKFGKKVYKKIDYKSGELRVTVVLTSKNELKLDIREWYEPE